LEGVAAAVVVFIHPICLRGLHLLAVGLGQVVMVKPPGKIREL
jgi:hypothetical protein